MLLIKEATKCLTLNKREPEHESHV